jgi:hypothetical protein
MTKVGTGGCQEEMVHTINDQQIFIISHGETISRSCRAPFVVEARIEPSTFRPVNPMLYQLSYLAVTELSLPGLSEDKGLLCKEDPLSKYARDLVVCWLSLILL